MKKISLKEHQQIMLEIMTEFADFCENNNLRYFLDAGTLLGAVRHKGFIPWDNDADVCMPRPDFDKLYILLEERNFKINDHLILEKPEDTIYPFFKIGDLRTRMVEFPDSFPVVLPVIVFVASGITP